MWYYLINHRLGGKSWFHKDSLQIKLHVCYVKIKQNLLEYCFVTANQIITSTSLIALSPFMVFQMHIITSAGANNALTHTHTHQLTLCHNLGAPGRCWSWTNRAELVAEPGVAAAACKPTAGVFSAAAELNAIMGCCNSGWTENVLYSPASVWWMQILSSGLTASVIFILIAFDELTLIVWEFQVLCRQTAKILFWNLAKIWYLTQTKQSW